MLPRKPESNNAYYQILLIFSGTLAAMFFGFLLGRLFTPGGEISYAVSNMVAFSFILCFYVLLHFFSPFSLIKYLQEKKLPFGKALFCGILGGIIAYPLIVFLSAGVQAVLETPFIKVFLERIGLDVSLQESVLTITETNDPWVLSLMVFTIVVLAPLCEEIFFRGCLYRMFRSYVGVIFGAILSGLIFGIIHFNLAAILPLVFFGIFLAFLYEKSGDIRVPIITHAFYNGLSVLLMVFVEAA